MYSRLNQPNHIETRVDSPLGLLAVRGHRVGLLGLAIVVMSAVDLYLTLLFVTQTGMNEMNPLARAMMEYQSPSLLAIWKAATVVLCVGILLMIRKQRSAEIGAWAGCLLLCWLMSHWIGFIREARITDLEIAQGGISSNPNWIMIDASADNLPSHTIID